MGDAMMTDTVIGKAKPGKKPFIRQVPVQINSRRSLCIW
jgi:hypothetical protein